MLYEADKLKMHVYQNNEVHSFVYQHDSALNKKMYIPCIPYRLLKSWIDINLSAEMCELI